ncbi:MAG: DNA mismatch repair protein MutL [Chlamydiia bacterium]|nr:DNA mismatch repair protein MutL [Chlamydiia bacterium]
MSKTIYVLSDVAIKQIAAGEVVEGPASVVKELCENAIDAGADKVSVEIKGGGHFLIEVSDNGKGIAKEDIPLTIEKFATSKIKTLEDLSTLSSMGFRGEALAAISSVSKFSILSSTGGVGTLLETSGGKDAELSQSARGRGTTITVESLFYNTPARKKFQKARGPSTTEIIKCVTKLSLCHKEVAFYLTVDGKEVFVAEGTAKNRVSDVLGKDFFTPIIDVNFETDGLKIEGVIAGPEKYRSNRLGQYLIVNKRNVYSLLVSNAVLSGFGSALGKGDYPLFFLDMSFDPSKIDVNVHPQKKEIRFQEEEKVFALVREAIASALTGSYEVYQERPKFTAPNSFDTNAFKNFSYVEKEDVTAIERSLPQRPFMQQTFEQKGFLSIKLLWDEICIVEVTAPHEKFPQVEDKECVLIDLSVLEFRNQKKELIFEGQKLLSSEEIFLSQAEVGVCKEFESSFKDLGIVYSMNDVSVHVEQMPAVCKGQVKDVFMYALHLLKQGEHVMHIKEKIHMRVLRKKKYTENEAIFLIERSTGDNFGSSVTKKDLRSLCKEYTI